MESLEPRWTPTWAGIPPALVSLPANSLGVTLNNNDASGTASIASTEVDYYSFTATASGTYNIAATTPSSSVDTVIGVFSATGQRLAYNDDVGGGNTDSALSINLVAGTRYYLGVTNYASWSRGSYSWLIDGPAATAVDDAYENNDTRATASHLGTLTQLTTIGQLIMADSADWYQFTTTGTAASSASVSIAFQNAQGDLDLELYNAAGTLLGRSGGTGNSELLSLASQPAGTYYVRVYGYRGATSPTYSLSINPTVTVPTTPSNPTTPTNPNSPVTAFPDVPYYGGGNDWNLNAINAPEAWAQGFRGQGVVVAVVDTGVDVNHPELMSQLWVNAGEIAGNGIDDDHNGYVDDTSGWDFASNDNHPDDLNGHGTHVAGTIAAAANGVGSTGVAPGARIMPVRVLDSNGSGTVDAVAAGIRYAARMGADIINLSLGGGFSSVIQSAIQYAQQLGVLVVAAAGNDGAGTPGYPARFSASLSNVLSVGAYSSSGSLASFSNDVGGSGAVQVDAPGVGVYSTYMDGRYATLSGTSMATPHVAGLAALILSANHNLTASQVRDIIVNGANRSIAGSDSRGGINAALSVAMAASGQTSAGATSAVQVASSQLATLRALRLLSVEGFDGVTSGLTQATIAGATAQATASVACAMPSVTQSVGPRSQAVDEALASIDWDQAADALFAEAIDGAWADDVPAEFDKFALA